MSKRQFAMLFLISLSAYTTGGGLLPLLPVYATRLGASPAIIGYYLSFSFLTLALGTLAGGWLFNRVRRTRLLLLLCGVVNAPSLCLMGQVTTVWQLAALTGTVFFMYGIGIALANILVSLSAEPHERGKMLGYRC